MKVTGGIEYLAIDGTLVNIAELKSFSITTEKNAVVDVLAGEPGIRTATKQAHIEITILLLPNQKVKDFVGKQNVNVQLKLKNGKKYTWLQACEVGDGEIDPSEGKLTLRYESAKARED